MVESKVYIVTDGVYSDYRIVACFTERKLASAFARNYGGEVEEWGLNPAVAEGFLKGYKLYSVEGPISSGPTDADVNTYEWQDKPLGGRPIADLLNASAYKDNPTFRIRVWAKNRKAAEKIAREYWAKWKASPQGVAYCLNPDKAIIHGVEIE